VARVQAAGRVLLGAHQLAEAQDSGEAQLLVEAQEEVACPLSSLIREPRFSAA
jgi:hypothetical protein